MHGPCARAVEEQSAERSAKPRAARGRECFMVEGAGGSRSAAHRTRRLRSVNPSSAAEFPTFPSGRLPFPPRSRRSTRQTPMLSHAGPVRMGRLQPGRSVRAHRKVTSPAARAARPPARTCASVSSDSQRAATTELSPRCDGRLRAQGRALGIAPRTRARTPARPRREPRARAPRDTRTDGAVRVRGRTRARRSAPCPWSTEDRGTNPVLAARCRRRTVVRARRGSRSRRR